MYVDSKAMHVEVTSSPPPPGPVVTLDLQISTEIWIKISKNKLSLFIVDYNSAPASIVILIVMAQLIPSVPIPPRICHLVSPGSGEFVRKLLPKGMT